tara:strand:- start:1176 stop:2408 length:1233 start_codon:yes stop_codon:yes gene_type:complete
LGSLLNSLFFNSPEQRTLLARQRYFEEGLMPSGLVTRVVFESWARSQRYGYNVKDIPEYCPVTNSRVQLTLQRNRELLQAWMGEVNSLNTVLVNTGTSAVLTDRLGVVIATTGSTQANSQIIPAAHRVGVDLSESAVGTTAPGIALATNQAAIVLGAEHFFDKVGSMFCAAAPISGRDGSVCGVLNLSSERRSFGFDALSVVGLFAKVIENRLLALEVGDCAVLGLQISPSLIGTPMMGLIGISGTGCISWANSTAIKLIKGSDAQLSLTGLPVEEVFDLRFDKVLSLGVDQEPVSARLTNGLTVYVRILNAQTKGAIKSGSFSAVPKTFNAQIESRLNLPEHESVTSLTEEVSEDLAKVAVRSLREADTTLILKTLDLCNGNISKAAKQLKVSRGVVYRRLKGFKHSGC